MFLSGKNGYTARGQQWAAGPFLLLCTLDPTFEVGVDHTTWWGEFGETRGIVRYVRMSQFGPWMMGTLKVGCYGLTVSGTYGSDGLTKKVPRFIWDQATTVPDELIAAWNTGGGHNSAGSEGPAMKRWAIKNQALLSTPRKVAPIPDFFSDYSTRQRQPVEHNDYVAWAHVGVDKLASITLRLTQSVEHAWDGICAFSMEDQYRMAGESLLVTPRLEARIEALRAEMLRRMAADGWTWNENPHNRFYYPPIELGWQWLVNFDGKKYSQFLASTGYMCDPKTAYWVKA